MSSPKQSKKSFLIKIASALTAIASSLFGIYQIAKQGSVITVEAPKQPSE